MGIIDQIKQLITKPADPAHMGLKESRFWPTLVNDFGYRMPQLKFTDIQSYQTSLKLVTWVYSCISLRASSTAMVDWYIMDKNNKEVESGDAYNLLKQPNEYEDWHQFIEASIFDLDTAGEIFWTKEQMNGLGQPKHLYRLDPKFIRVVPDPKTFIKGYIFEVNGHQIAYAPHEVIHIKTPNPLDPFRGMGRIEAAHITLETDSYAAQFNRDFFRNGAKLTGVLQTKDELTDAEYDRMRNEWQRLYTGRKNMHKVAVLEANTEYKPVGISQKEMDFLQLRVNNRDEICAIFSVPPPKLGIYQRGEYNKAEADRTFWAQGILPILKKLEGKLDKLVRTFDPNLRFEFEEVVKADEEQQSKILDIYSKNGVLTINEQREILGYESVPWGDTVYIPSTMQAIAAPTSHADTIDTQLPDEDIIPSASPETDTDSGRPTPTPEQLPENPGFTTQYTTEQSARRAEIRQIKSLLADVLKELDSAPDPTPTKMTLQQKKAFVNKAANLQDKIIGEFHSAMKSFFKDQGERALANVFDAGTGKLTAAKILPKKKENAAIIKAAKPHIDAAMNLGVEHAVSLVEHQKKILKKAISPARLNRVTAKLGGRITQINDTTRDKIRDVLKTGLSEGYGINEIAYGNTDTGFKGIKDVFDEADGYRSELIAQTEVTTAYAEGSMETYRDLDVAQKEWITAGDDRVDDDCQSDEDDGPVGIDDTFSSGDDQPPAHPGCRCDVLPVVE